LAVQPCTYIGGIGTPLSPAIFVIAGVVLDFAVLANLVLGQRVIFSLAPEICGRLNSVFMTTFFCSGAIGSALGRWLFAHYGWHGVSMAAIAFVLAAVYFHDRPHARMHRRADTQKMYA